jgi:hypothetical protein
MAVVAFDVRSSEPFAGGQQFDAVGSYTRIDGVLTFAVDPRDPANACIADLALAPRDADGRVRFESDVVFVTPSEPARGNGALILDVPNRGRTVTGHLNGASDRGMRPPGPVPLEAFDGHTFRRGFSILTVGWQTDMVPIEHSLAIRAPIAGSESEPVTGAVWADLRPHADAPYLEISQLGNKGYPPLNRQDSEARLYEYAHEGAAPRLVSRDRWRFARLNEGREEPSETHVCLEGGFQAGHIYRLQYRSVNPPVVGAGLLAVRDAASYFRRAEVNRTPVSFDRVIGYGVSQTGRVLRTFLTFGLNADEDGRKVFDGVLSIIAGGPGRGDYNQRFGLPSSLAIRSFGDLFPFADATMTDALSGQTDGVLARSERSNVVPRVIYLNSAYEYWVSHASLLHTDPALGTDAPIHPSVRAYLVAGASHAPGNVPQSADMAILGARARYGLNVVAYAPLIRAALVNLDRWIAEGTEPPASRVPRWSDGTALSRENGLRLLRALPGIEPPPLGNLRAIRQLDLGAGAERGVGAFPPHEGAAYACHVSALDDDLNEVAGIRLPDLTVPVGTHVGWNVLETGNGRSEYAPTLQGMTRFFSRDESERDGLGDPRPSIADRYTSRDDYLERVRYEAQRLVEDGLLLPEDIDVVVENCADRYNEALRVGPNTPTG